MTTPTPPHGPGLFEVTRADGNQPPARRVTSIRRLAGAEQPPGSVLIGWAAWLLTLIGAGALYVSFSAQRQYVFAARHQDAASTVEALLVDLLMIVFTLLGLGMARAGKAARTERALILACGAASAYMNISAADVASPRSVAAYALAPIALAVAVDRVIAVIRRHVLAAPEPGAWTALGAAAAAAVRLTGLVLLYALRLALAPVETARGLRRMLLDAAPLPAPPAAGDCETAGPPPTKKAVLLALYRAHPDYGDRGKASRVAGELAPQAGLQPGTARTYLYAELDETTS